MLNGPDITAHSLTFIYASLSNSHLTIHKFHFSMTNFNGEPQTVRLLSDSFL